MDPKTNAQDWEDNTFAGLETIDDEGQSRVSRLGLLAEDEQPARMSGEFPAFDEGLEVEASRLA